MTHKTKIKISISAVYRPLFGNIKHDDNTMSAFVDVDKISIQTCVIRILLQKQFVINQLT